MARKSRDSERVRVLGFYSDDAYVFGGLTHIDFPEWVFHLGLARNGTVHRFEVVREIDSVPRRFAGRSKNVAYWPPRAPIEDDEIGLTSRRLRDVPLGELRDALIERF